ncbi:Diphthine--ammonia ligase/Uncharacterised protein MJ0570 like protein [Aduncisulcus paluster]|uniref:Diphthine--ammonia ligase n=1 Tax=Aduncisulcus paluster TaxID=2918883 RepID=A0ABQ5KTY4_9EUKA|nr:Diphthine--ammonia ligase/Uncharacterised protein MJ0570 like protein [Aduncisulcus paluster]
MKFVSLISGGKDSTFAHWKCVLDGHIPLCIASLISPGSGPEEKDSFSFQTVGTRFIDFIAECMDLPLIKRDLVGEAVLLDSSYKPTDGDEVEDLFVLLTEVKARFPEVKGVCTGALWSDYQRVRIENVCERLDLTPLSPLWHCDQGELIEEMASAKHHGILIKVASMGLKTSVLGKSIVNIVPQLKKLGELYGMNVAGEGGEFETFTIDSPCYKKKIEIIESEIIVTDHDEMAPVAYFVIKDVRVVPKEEEIVE